MAPVYDRFTEGFCDCGHADRASPARLAPAVFRNAHLLATAMRAKFALGITFQCQTWGATVPVPPIDVRAQWSTRHQDNAAAHARMREFLFRTLSSLSDALMSAQWREDWILARQAARVLRSSRMGWPAEAASRMKDGF